MTFDSIKKEIVERAGSMKLIRIVLVDYEKVIPKGNAFVPMKFKECGRKTLGFKMEGGKFGTHELNETRLNARVKEHWAGYVDNNSNIEALLKLPKLN